MQHDLTESINFPRTDEAFAKKTGIGTLLLFPGIALVLPLFLVLGYYFRVLKDGLESKTQLPEWDQFGRLFIQGLTCFAVLLVYMLPGSLLGAVALIPGMAMRGGSIFEPQNILSTFLKMGAGVLCLVGQALIPMALARFAHTGKLASAFQIKEIIEQIKASVSTYGKLVIALCVSSVVIGYVGRFLTAVPFYLGTFFTMALAFYTALVFMHWTGAIYRDRCLPAPAAAPAVGPLPAVLPAPDELE